MTSRVIDAMTSSRDDGCMQRALLRADVAFSAACGVSFTVLSAGLAEWAGIPGWIVLGVGLLIVAHTGILVVGLLRPEFEDLVVRYAVVANLGWVVGAIVVLAAGWLPEAPAGLFGLLSAIVGLFGVLQWRTLRKGSVAPRS